MADNKFPDQEAAPSDPERSEPLQSKALFPIIGIGASAGGLEACTQLLAGLPARTGMAYVPIQHLDPHHESRLGDILGKVTELPVLEAQDGLAVAPDHVYVIPPNKSLTLKGDVLQLAPRTETRTLHLPIDDFLKSLAEERQARAIGVILSGTGSDGTLGMEEIKAAGGITFAQDEESARFGSMPQSAARSGCVDFVLPPDAIARELLRIGQHPFVAPVEDITAAQIPPSDENYFQKILELLRSSVGVDFRAYRDTTIRRRIMRRMVLNTKESIGEYFEQLNENAGEIEALYQDILINVTSFFRDAEAFEALKQRVFPHITRDKHSTSTIRIWVPGCSTGQEAYSLAMVLLEYLDTQVHRPQIQIFATDLSESVSLAKAREGLYPDSIEGDVSPERLRRFFVKEDSKYRINKTVRDLCVFAKQNVAADPPFSRVDLISCRNLLIYLAGPLQKRVLPTFHYALNEHGFLMLGASETIGPFGDLFTMVDHKNRLYEKKPYAARQYPNFRADEFQLAAVGGRRETGTPSTPVDWQREADRVVLGKYAPAGVVVNRDFDVLQFRGHTGPYLTPAPGDASFNVLKMAREGLFLELRSALNAARDQNSETRRTGLQVRTGAEVRSVDLQVQPLKLPGVNEHCFLVMFEDTDAQAALARHATTLQQERVEGSGLRRRLGLWLLGEGSPARPSSPPAGAEQSDLRRELASARDYLQSVIEQQDAANEELKSANEEILSSNEELQSTNEELETAKEELQSVNEELITINEQLQNRNLELNRLSDDLSNLLASANVPMIALGIDLRIRRFTPAAAKLLNLVPSDVGRPITNFKPTVEVPDLEALVGRVVQTVNPIEREVSDGHGAYLLQIFPYRTAENKIDGVVIVLQNIQEFKNQAARLQRTVDLINLSLDAIFTRDAQSGAITFWNSGAERMYGWSPDEALGRIAHTLLPTIYPDKINVLDVLRSEGRWAGELRHVRRDGTPLDIDSRQVWQGNDGPGAPSILEINRDITGRKQLEKRLADADLQKNEFLAMLAHELRNPLAPLRNGLQALRLKGGDESDTPTHEMLERQLKHMTRLVDDLLDVPRITQGRIELRKRELDLVELLGAVAESVKDEVKSAGQKLTLRLTSDPITVDGDPVRLAEIVENLLNNAIKYSDRGAHISLSAGREGGQAVVKVRDTGIGISAEMLPHIWDMFAQADSSLERTRGGLGIGLTLVKHLTELHGGKVEARSDGLRKGSEFTVRLPALAGKVTLDAASRTAPKPAAAAPSTARRILIVDDNADAAESLELLLKLSNHDTRVAYGGIEALEAAAEFNPHIVLLDIGLPGLNGYEVARKLRENGDKTHIIAVSGYGADDSRKRGTDAGFDAHMLKPIDFDHLSELIAQAKV